MSRHGNGETSIFPLLLWIAIASVGCEPSSTVTTEPAPTLETAPASAPPSANRAEGQPIAAPSTAASTISADAGPAAATVAEPNPRTWRADPIATDFSQAPLFFTGAFDGSQRFGMWAETMAFARKLAAQRGRPVHFTYFVNTVFYDLAASPTGIDRVRNLDELLIRTALTQQAINEGHEIANHGVGHLDGSQWDESRWRQEFVAFHRVTDALLFEPIKDDSGRAVFPRFAPRPGAPKGDTGAACNTDTDCDSQQCLKVTPEVSLCVTPCNRKQACPTGTVCGAPNFGEDTDVCLPKPSFPVVHRGETLFDDRGRANLNAKQLRPYRIVGFRAPFLVFGDPVLKVLQERDYQYDTSLIVPMGPPLLLSFESTNAAQSKHTYEFALMKHPDALSAPMDYNYDKLGGSGERMFADYAMSLTASSEGSRHPWNIGHHFAQWREGAYWRAMKQTYEFAAADCPGAGGQHECRNVQMVSFRELAQYLRASAIVK